MERGKKPLMGGSGEGMMIERRDNLAGKPMSPASTISFRGNEA
jgi:hypothetical protein